MNSTFYVQEAQEDVDERTTLLGANRTAEEEKLGQIPEDKRQMLLRIHYDLIRHHLLP